MKPGTIIVAVGGNALSPPGERGTIQEQFAHTRSSLGVIVELARDGWGVMLVHGNGPQVGQALTRNELASHVVEPLPLGVLVAATAGWIGYMIQQSLQNAFCRAGIERNVLTLITQTVVDKEDPRLRHPTKPIGNVLTPDRIERLQRDGVALIADGRGRVRRAAASPLPIAIVEADAVAQLVEEGTVVVAAGGGGPPVWRDEAGVIEGIDAVVDKDLAAAILGRAVGANTLLILTDVDAVYENWDTPDARPIRSMSLAQATAMISQEDVGAGSMRPKLQAAVAFVEGGGKRAVIAKLEDGIGALRGESGTTITGATSESV